MRWLLLGLVVGGAWTQRPPRLVVGIVVDQMRADYLRRFVSRRSQGFGRLLQEGLVYWNCHYPYFPTYTGPGHASIYTGTTPAFHGIVANEWWDRTLQSPYYCVSDSTVAPVGTSSPKARRSPCTLWATTITDELRYASRFRNKTISIALKDRSAILPAGRSGTLALWFDAKQGRWVTSSYYAEKLPDWVEQFNAQGYADSLLRLPWQLSKRFACRDDSPHEGIFAGESQSTFPHTLRDYEALARSPAGNWLTLHLARKAIEAEKLGRGRYTDFLAISLSSPDLVGHLFGTESCEIEDLYHMLDRQLADFFAYLIRRFRREELLIFLTADHGAAPTPEVMAEQGLSMGRYPEKALLDSAQRFLCRQLGLPDTGAPIAAFLNQNFYFSPSLSMAKRAEAAHLLKGWLLQQPFIMAAYTMAELSAGGSEFYPFKLVQAGFLPSRSGDVVVVYAPGWIEGGYQGGTTHGSIWTYDTHVPLLWWGGGIQGGTSYERVTITQIAPTLAFVLGTPLPSGAIAPPLLEVIDRWRTPVFTWEENFSGN